VGESVIGSSQDRRGLYQGPSEGCGFAPSALPEDEGRPIRERYLLRSPLSIRPHRGWSVPAADRPQAPEDRLSCDPVQPDL